MKQVISNGQSGLDVRNALNDNFTELYNSLSPPIKLSNITGNNSVSITANTRIVNIYSSIASGTPSLKVGTASGGGQILDTLLIASGTPNKYTVEWDYELAGTLWIFVSGGNANIRIEIINNLM